MVGPDCYRRHLRTPARRNHRERDHLLRPPQPVELPDRGIALDRRSEPIRRLGPDSRGNRFPDARLPDRALLAPCREWNPGDLDLDRGARDPARNLHRDWTLLGPRPTLRTGGGPNPDPQTFRGHPTL